MISIASENGYKRISRIRSTHEREMYRREKAEDINRMEATLQMTQ